MARIQILELPMEHHGDDTVTPFVLIIDQYEEPQRFVTAEEADTLHAQWQHMAEQTGARAVLAFPFQVDIPANQVTLDDSNTLPVTFKVAGDFSEFREQLEAEVRSAARLKDVGFS